jgi:hypothetical protein
MVRPSKAVARPAKGKTRFPQWPASVTQRHYAEGIGPNAERTVDPARIS